MPITAAQYARRVNGYSEIVKVEVGATRQSFIVYKTLAIGQSEFFRAVTSPAWNSDRPIDLSDEEPRAFAVFSHWLEWNEICICDTDYGISPVSNEFTPEDVELFIAAYYLGLKLLAFRFCDAVIDTLETALAANTGVLTADHIEQVYTRESPLRRLVVDCFVRQAGTEPREDLDVDYHPEFIAELARALYNSRRNGYAEGQPGCKYHQHSVEQPCETPKPSAPPDSVYMETAGEKKIFRFVVGGQGTVIYSLHTTCINCTIRLDGKVGLGCGICCFKHQSRSEHRTINGIDVTEVHLPTLNPTALEMYMHWYLVGWTYADVLTHLMVKPGDAGAIEDSLIVLVDLYYLGTQVANQAVRNHAVNAMVEWTRRAQKMPPGRVIDHAFNTLGPVYDPMTSVSHSTPKLNRCLLLLTGLYACNDVFTGSTNIHFLRALSICYRSIQIKLLRRPGSERERFAKLEAPYSGKYLCRYFHEHSRCIHPDRAAQCSLNHVEITRGPCLSLGNWPEGGAGSPSFLELCEERFKAAVEPANAPVVHTTVEE